jgi:hypothetical protein
MHHAEALPRLPDFMQVPDPGNRERKADAEESELVSES